MNKIIEELGLDDSLTKAVPKVTRFTKVKDNIPLKANLNFQADLLFLPEDTNTQSRYCLMVLDLASNQFDMEPVKNKEPKTILAAIEKMNKRKFIHIDKNSASLSSDPGTEFKGVFAKWLYKESIYHKITMPNRHTQLSNINYLCRQLGKLFNLYMNKKEKETKKVYTNWCDIIDQVRIKLNAHRKNVLPEDLTTYEYPIFNFEAPPNKYNVGDIVLRALDAPENALGHRVYGKFRESDFRWDVVPHKIERVLYYSPPINFRYMLAGFPNASFTEAQLRPSKEEEEKYIVKQIIDKRIVGKKVEYKIWWKGYLKKDATWQSKTQLIEDGLQKEIDDYEANY